MTEMISKLAVYAMKLPTAYYCSAFGLAGASFGALFIKNASQRLQKLLNISTYIGIALSIILACSYLYYPGYFDHVESTIATLGVIFNHNENIYPEFTDYSFHGLPYGPVLAELQAIVQKLDLPLISSSKLPGVISMTLAFFVLLRTLRNELAISYLILLLPFGLLMFWNRAEPIILMCVSLALATHPYLDKYSTRLFSMLFCGFLGGISICIKLHAGIYVVAAMLASSSVAIFGIAEIGVFVASMLATVFFVTLPEQISIVAFYDYIGIAGKHGLNLRLLIINVMFFCLINSPIIYINYIDRKSDGRWHIFSLSVLLLEVAVVVVGAKSGAGAHHLMQFVPINAFILQSLLSKNRKIALKLDFLRVELLFVAFGALLILGELAERMAEEFALQARAKHEMLALADKYPGLVMGVSDMNGYPYTFYRPLLELKGTRQVDIPGFMDLDFAGISDAPLANALADCKFPYLAIPNTGQPFSIENYYTSKPLLSNDVRLAFAESYKSVEIAETYSVYQCK